MIIGHNPVFDIGAISCHTGKSCDEKLYGALSLGLCNCREAEEIAEARKPGVSRCADAAQRRTKVALDESYPHL